MQWFSFALFAAVAWLVVMAGALKRMRQRQREQAGPGLSRRADTASPQQRRLEFPQHRKPAATFPAHRATHNRIHSGPRHFRYLRPRRPQRSTLPLVLVFLCTLAPIVAAFVVYYNPQWWPDDASNYGTLVTPQRPMPAASELKLTTLDGQPFDLRTLKGKWLLVAADGAACPESCARKLYITRNSHASQGKNVDRLARVWFITDDAPVPDKVLEAYKGTIMLRADPGQLARFLLAGQQQQAAPAGRAHLDHRSAGQPDDAVPGRRRRREGAQGRQQAGLQLAGRLTGFFDMDMDRIKARYRKLVFFTWFLTLDLIMFGAFVRLTDSGLGCPDWPGCYGKATPWARWATSTRPRRPCPSGRSRCPRPGSR